MRIPEEVDCVGWKQFAGGCGLLQPERSGFKIVWALFLHPCPQASLRRGAAKRHHLVHAANIGDHCLVQHQLRPPENCVLEHIGCVHQLLVVKQTQGLSTTAMLSTRGTDTESNT